MKMVPSVTKTIIEDIGSSGSSPNMLQKMTVSMSKLTKKYDVPVSLKDMIVLTRKLYSYFGDLVKDIFFVTALGYLIQGGGAPLFWVITE